MNKLYTYLAKNKNRYIQELVEFCTQPSIAAENRGMQKMAKMVKQKLINLGANVETLSIESSYPFIFAEIKSNKPSAPTILIYDHYDVQPEEPLELWNTDPFQPEIKNGKFYARGVSDDKVNLLFRIQVIEAWKKVFKDLPVNIKFLIEGEEEIGSPHLQKLAQKYGHLWNNCDVCLWESGGVDEQNRPKINLGMKGILYVELSCEFNAADLHSGNAVIIDSPVWRLIHALSSLRDIKGNVIINDFYKNRQETDTGETELMHRKDFNAGMFLKTLGSSHPLADQDNKFEFLEKMYFNGSCNVCGIWAGYTEPKGIKTVLPNKAIAKLDFRLVEKQKTHEILQALRNHLDSNGFSDVKIKKLAAEEGGKTDIENKYVQKTLQVLEKVYKKEVQLEITSLGSGPIYEIACQYNIPVINIGACNPESRAHAPNENIKLDDYWLAQKAFASLIKSL